MCYNERQRYLRRRVISAKRAFAEKGLLLISSIDIEIRKYFLKAYVWRVALHGSETWTIREEGRQEIEAVGMWCYRRMLNIRCLDKITNEKILNRVHEDRLIHFD